MCSQGWLEVPSVLPLSTSALLAFGRRPNGPLGGGADVLLEAGLSQGLLSSWLHRPHWVPPSPPHPYSSPFSSRGGASPSTPHPKCLKEPGGFQAGSEHLGGFPRKLPVVSIPLMETPLFPMDLKCHLS